MVAIGLLILAFWLGVPLYLGGLLLYYWLKKRRPGLLFWILTPLVALVWIGTIVLGIIGARNNANAANLTATTSSSDNTTPASPPQPLNMPGWDTTADGNTWLNDAEADKQSFCTAAAAASPNHHSAPFFYTNLNASYDPNNADSLKVAMLDLAAKLDATSPKKSYPSLQGYSWTRMNTVKTAKGEVQMILVFWQDGHMFLHSQSIQPDGTYTMAGLDGPWDGDAYYSPGTITVSGNNFTMKLTTGDDQLQTGTFQVSVDGQEMDLTEGGRTPNRYTKGVQLMPGDLFPGGQ